MIPITDAISLQDDELDITFIRASGPGGQNVNKVSSAVQLRFDARRSRSLPNSVSIRLQALAGSRLTLEGIIVITADRFRTQALNRADAIERLSDLIRKAAYRPPVRHATKPTKASKVRRLDSKVRRGDLKSTRSRPTSSD
ncbi:MAG: alternative ribosome rescue aminoacyl-tRNA hydrolase ArfB [Caulobacteraceae bacterium]|nr:alternative ribosome rescue aminoacyl-tRNA hydrolase ArfB [Caulobacteraceae bacterium]